MRAAKARDAAVRKLSNAGVIVGKNRLKVQESPMLRKPHPADRRSLLVTLIPARLQKLAGMYEGVESETRRVLANCRRAILKLSFASLQRWAMCGGAATQLPLNPIDAPATVYRPRLPPPKPPGRPKPWPYG